MFDESTGVNKTSGPASAHRSFAPREFRQAWWLRGPHLQTVGGKYLRPRPTMALERVRVDTPDGDFLDLDFGPEPDSALPPRGAAASPGGDPARGDGGPAPIALVLHGLEGSTARAYMRLAKWEILRRGLRPVGMNFRACSGVPNLLPRFYHSGETGDLAFVLEHLHGRFPDRPIGVLGFSLGGNVLLRYLGEIGSDAPPWLTAAVAVSVPFDLTEGTRMLEETRMGRVYAGYFLRSLKAKTRAKAKLLERIVDVERALSARTVREFDEAATAPLHGFPDAAVYYREASSGPIVGDVRVPTLVLHGLDDPFLPPEAVPLRAIESNPWIQGAIAANGGHVGFVAGDPGTAWFWAEREAARYLGEVLGAKE